LLSPGEFVVSREGVKALGIPALHKINAGLPEQVFGPYWTRLLSQQQLYDVFNSGPGLLDAASLKKPIRGLAVSMKSAGDSRTIVVNINANDSVFDGISVQRWADKVADRLMQRVSANAPLRTAWT
jgi:hypothetical protein